MTATSRTPISSVVPGTTFSTCCVVPYRWEKASPRYFESDAGYSSDVLASEALTGWYVLFELPACDSE